MRRLVLGVVCGVGATFLWGGGAASAAARCTESVPYRAGTDGYASFRIPAVIRAADGAVLAFAEGRHAGSADSGDIDVVLRRSHDGGCTWTPLRVVARGDGDTRGNPAPVLDPVTRRIVLLTSYNAGSVTETQILQGAVTAEQSRRVFVQTSADNGATFSAPREITATAKRTDWRWYATGPGHAVALPTGRLVVPANHSLAPPAGSPDLGSEPKYYGGHDLYSDDHGRTWHIGFTDDNPDGYLNVNETSATRLPDGRLYFNARDQNGTSPATRTDAYSSDGGTTLDAPYAPQPSITGPVVQGSVLQMPAAGPLLYSAPASPTTRSQMTLHESPDQGRTWKPTLKLTNAPAAYSDLVPLPPNTAGLLYETGPTTPNETITFRRIPIR